MAHRISWTQTAREDLKSIVRYISAEDPEAARRLAESILDQIEYLADFPMSGRVVPEKDQETVRETLLPPYRIIYVFEAGKEVLFVNRIWHSARGEPDV
jgi:toxin ParE1/3/4